MLTLTSLMVGCQGYAKKATKITPYTVHPDIVGIPYEIKQVKQNKCGDPRIDIVRSSKPRLSTEELRGMVCISKQDYEYIWKEMIVYERSLCKPEERN